MKTAVLLSAASLATAFVIPGNDQQLLAAFGEEAAVSTVPGLAKEKAQHSGEEHRHHGHDDADKTEKVKEMFAGEVHAHDEEDHVSGKWHRAAGLAEGLQRFVAHFEEMEHFEHMEHMEHNEKFSAEGEEDEHPHGKEGKKGKFGKKGKHGKKGEKGEFKEKHHDEEHRHEDERHPEDEEHHKGKHGKKGEKGEFEEEHFEGKEHEVKEHHHKGEKFGKEGEKHHEFKEKHHDEEHHHEDEEHFEGKEHEDEERHQGEKKHGKNGEKKPEFKGKHHGEEHHEDEERHHKGEKDHEFKEEHFEGKEHDEEHHHKGEKFGKKGKKHFQGMNHDGHHGPEDEHHGPFDHFEHFEHFEQFEHPELDVFDFPPCPHHARPNHKPGFFGKVMGQVKHVFGFSAPESEEPIHHGAHHEANQTIYELISGSNHTSIFTHIISQYDDVVSYLNSTEANYTVFVPVDKAFENIHEHNRNFTKEAVFKWLEYHISPEVFTLHDFFDVQTVPTFRLEENDNKYPQRISTSFTPKGLTLNFHSHVFRPDIVCSTSILFIFQ
jgi:Fasciclin domain